MTLLFHHYYKYSLFLFCLLTKLQFASSHSRWKCPEARSPSIGIKYGPCGSDTNDFSSFGEPIDISPGPLRVIFEEAIYHVGAPFRIALSGDGSDDDTCTLLDHVPHNDEVTRPSPSDPDTYVPYSITLEIPDISCERCSLHLANPMTDKIGYDGSPDGAGCTDPFGSCFSVYYSCTVPLRISGSVPREDYVCPQNGSTGPADWPTQWIGDGGYAVDASVPGVYRRESSAWSPDAFVLTTAPERYRKDAGGVCGASGKCTPKEVKKEKNKKTVIKKKNGNKIVKNCKWVIRKIKKNADSKKKYCKPNKRPNGVFQVCACTCSSESGS